VSIRYLFALLAVVSLAGCASDPAPNEQLKLTEQAIEQAKAVGASDDVPELPMAEAKYAQARSAMLGKSYKDARMLAEESELDARLAEAKVLTAKSQAQLNQLATRLNRLHKQLGSAQ
jgi:PBP1b-binding outer membrane lipoprotein LpoB